MMLVRPARAAALGASALLFAAALGVARAEEDVSSGADEPERAPGPASAVDVEIAGEAMYLTPPIRGASTPFGAGFGARVGVSLSGFYLGARVIDFLGGKDVDVSYRALLYGVELGYDLRWPAFGGALWLLRPRVGLGGAAVYYTDPSLLADVVTSASGSSSASDTLTVNTPYVQPGATLELAAGAHFIAIGASTLVLPRIAYGGADATTWVSYSAELEVGFRF
jgi:hypothetical protein